MLHASTCSDDLRPSHTELRCGFYKEGCATGIFERGCKETAKRAGRILRPSGGPGTNDPGRIRYPSVSLKDLGKSAYLAKEYELAGPSWMDAETFAIVATMPPSTTKDQFRLMLQNLLAERFQLKIHRENRHISAYSLAVAKDGPKLGRGGSIHLTAKGPDGAALAVADQFLRHQGPATGASNWTGLRVTMSELADKLAEETQRPVVNATGLNEKYDFTLTFRRAAVALPPEAEDLPDIFSALRSLGLRLDPGKKSVEVIVIDRLEKTPTEN